MNVLVQQYVLNTNVASSSAEENQVERHRCDGIDDKPALDVVDGDLARIRHHLQRKDSHVLAIRLRIRTPGLKHASFTNPTPVVSLPPGLPPRTFAWTVSSGLLGF